MEPCILHGTYIPGHCIAAGFHCCQSEALSHAVAVYTQKRNITCIGITGLMPLAYD